MIEPVSNPDVANKKIRTKPEIPISEFFRMNVKTTNEVDNSSPQTVSMIPANVRIRVRLLSTIFRVSSTDISSSGAESSFVIFIKAHPACISGVKYRINVSEGSTRAATTSSSESSWFLVWSRQTLG